MPQSSVLVRFAVAAIFAVFTFGFLVPPGQAQPGRPPGFPAPRPPGFPASPRPPGGISGMPGRPPGGITGMPGGIHGVGGTGISGISGTGIHGIGGTGISGVGGAGISGIGGTGISGMGGPGFGPSRTETVWTCSKCKFELGRGPVDPGQSSCPRCGVRFTGSTIGPGGFSAIPSAPPVVPAPAPPATSPPVVAPELPMNPAAGGRAAPAPTVPEASTAPSSSEGAAAPSDDPPASNGRSRTIKLIGIVCGSILLLGALAALGVVVANASSSKPTRRPPRRREYDDF